MRIARRLLGILGVMVVLAAPGAAQILLGGKLSVTPLGGLTSSGKAGGPFSPPSMTYSLSNTGDQSFTWGSTHSQSWVTVSPAGGSLAVGASVDVVVSINSQADTLLPGTYTDTVFFSNQTSGLGSTSRPVTLTVSDGPPPTIKIDPTPPDVTKTSPLTVQGTASPGPGNFPIAQVLWSNVNANWTWAGYASGTSEWSAQIPLEPGENDITITAIDTAGGRAVASFVVTYAPSGARGDGGGGGGGTCGATGLEGLLLVGALLVRRKTAAKSQRPRAEV